MQRHFLLEPGSHWLADWQYPINAKVASLTRWWPWSWCFLKGTGSEGLKAFTHWGRRKGTPPRSDRMVSGHSISLGDGRNVSVLTSRSSPTLDFQDHRMRKYQVSTRDHVTQLLLDRCFPALVLCSVDKSCPNLCDSWTIAHQAPLSLGFSRQECWSGLPFPLPGIFPTQEWYPHLLYLLLCRRILYLWRKKPSLMRETWLQSVGQEDPLEKGMSAHSSILAWRLPWTEEPGTVLGVAKSRTRLSD